MGAAGRVAVYSFVIVVGALLGAAASFFARREDRKVALLAFAAGVMLGAAFFHMFPEAFHSGGYASFAWAPVGFVLLFVLERYVLVHACEEPPGCETPGHGAVGLAAFLGLATHTLFDGVALGSAVAEGVGFMA